MKPDENVGVGTLNSEQNQKKKMNIKYYSMLRF